MTLSEYIHLVSALVKSSGCYTLTVLLTYHRVSVTL